MNERTKKKILISAESILLTGVMIVTGCHLKNYTTNSTSTTNSVTTTQSTSSVQSGSSNTTTPTIIPTQTTSVLRTAVPTTTVSDSGICTIGDSCTITQNDVKNIGVAFFSIEENGRRQEKKVFFQRGAGHICSDFFTERAIFIEDGEGLKPVDEMKNLMPGFEYEQDIPVWGYIEDNRIDYDLSEAQYIGDLRAFYEKYIPKGEWFIMPWEKDGMEINDNESNISELQEEYAYLSTQDFNENKHKILAYRLKAKTLL